MSKIRIVLLILSFILWVCLIIRSYIFGVIGVATAIGATFCGVNFGIYIADVIRAYIYRK